MRLFLIRHGETVDNVAGVYAGSRDSALTVHGVLQARQLAEHLRSTRPALTHLFASPLQRAFKTADALRTAQIAAAEKADRRGQSPIGEIQCVQDLVEQDFGFYEGKPFYARQQGSSVSGKQTHYDAHKDEPGFVDVESKSALDERATRFISQQLCPLLESEDAGAPLCVAVVSHGILLSHLWRCFTRMLPPRSVSVAPEVLALRGEVTLERLGGFSNTGFLEILVHRQMDDTRPVHTSILDADALGPLCGNGIVPGSTVEEAEPASPSRASKVASPQMTRLNEFTVEILVVNGQTHLRGVKRARGGIGRMRYDEGQKTIDSFFKQPKR